MAVCCVKVCDSWCTFHFPCWKRKHHVVQEEFSSTIANFPRTTESILLFAHILKRSYVKMEPRCVPDSRPRCMSRIYIYTE